MPDDQVFLITGASTGIGAATARHAARAGYRLVLNARSEDRLRALAEELGGEDRAVVAPGDVTEWEDHQRMVAAALDHFGRLDVVFANAGFGATSGFLKESPEQWRSMILTNVYGVALTIRASIEAVREARGHFLLMGSVAGRKTSPGNVYSATKFAVGALAESLREELNDSGARVTLIEPGAVETPFWDDPSKLKEPLAPDDVAEAIMFAVTRPPHVDVNDILIRPTAQSR